MVRTRMALVVATILALGTSPSARQAPLLRSALHDYRVVTVVEGLEHPWSIAFLPGGDMLVTEQPGRLRVVRDGNRFPAWRGNLFVGGLKGEQLARLTLDGQRVVLEETLLHGMGRIRDVRQGPDGYIYVAIDGLPVDGKTTPTPILRLEPAGDN